MAYRIAVLRGSAARQLAQPVWISPIQARKIANAANPAEMDSQAQPRKVKSILQAGAVMKGLQFFKNADPIQAKEDSEYPSWIFDLVEGEGAKPQTGSAASRQVRKASLRAKNFSKEK